MTLSKKMFYGIELAGIELLCIFGIGELLRSSFRNINPVIYYWLIITVITGFLWEPAFVYQYRQVQTYADLLIINNTSVWFDKYTLDYLIPHKFSMIFYSTYGAWADREYMDIGNYWSRIIESTHALFCGLFAALCLVFYLWGDRSHYNLLLGVSMGSQLMNSILYMGEYFIQTADINSPNYDTAFFPTGRFLSARPFMWINIFWTIMPLYAIITMMFSTNRVQLRSTPHRYSAPLIKSKY